MSKLEAARYRTTNWKSYNDALRRRGSLLIWLDKDLAWLADKAGRLGRSQQFSDAAIHLPDGKGALRPAAAAKHRDGCQHPGDGRAGLAGARLLHLEPQAEDPFCAGPPPLRAKLSEPAGRQPQDQVFGRWRMAGPQARHTPKAPIPQGPSGYGHGQR